MTDIRIYQINLDRDNDGVAFEPYGSLARYQNSPDVNPALYDMDSSQKLTFSGQSMLVLFAQNKTRSEMMALVTKTGGFIQ